jgi:LacI family transcriptional regulator
MPVTPSLKPRPRLRDIADRMQLSVTTVSMALRGSDEIASETRARIQQLAQRMGYASPPHGRRTRRSPQVQQRRYGLCFLGAGPGVSTNALVRGASHAALQTRARVEVLMIPELSEHQRVLDQVLEFGAKLNGVLLWGFIDRTLLEGLSAAGVRYVVLGISPFLTGELPEKLVHVISHDAMGMGWTATASLLARGHRRIGFVCETMPPRMYNANWLAGYRQAHWEASVPIDESLCVVTGQLGTAGDKGSEAILWLPPDQRPTAYVFSDASAAARFIETMKRHDAAPRSQDVVVGAEPEDVERFGIADCGLILSNLDRIAEFGVNALDRAASGMPLLCGRLEVPFRTENFEVVAAPHAS